VAVFYPGPTTTPLGVQPVSDSFLELVFEKAGELRAGGDGAASSGPMTRDQRDVDGDRSSQCHVPALASMECDVAAVPMPMTGPGKSGAGVAMNTAWRPLVETKGRWGHAAQLSEWSTVPHRRDGRGAAMANFWLLRH